MSIYRTLLRGTIFSLVGFSIASPTVRNTPSPSRAKSERDNSATPVYRPILKATSDNFFDHFITFDGHDPTNGFVNYTDMNFAEQQGLLTTMFNTELNKPTTYVGMDHTHIMASGRNSVRLSSKMNFTIGSLFVFDVAHVPTAYGQWSSFWLLGQDGVWPGSGEIDIFESVHESTSNTVTLHTAAGCSVSSTSTALGKLTQNDCHAGNGNLGCGYTAPPTINMYNQAVNTAGKPFNDQNGGVFVLEWTTDGIKVWQFSREAAPNSLDTLSPSTNDFPPPVAHFTGSGCAFENSFRDMQLIINADLCGDWAGNVWKESGAAAATGVAACADYVRDHPEAFGEAYFEFVSLMVYQLGS